MTRCQSCSSVSAAMVNVTTGHTHGRGSRGVSAAIWRATASWSATVIDTRVDAPPSGSPMFSAWSHAMS